VAPIFPVPGYADGAALSGPLASSSRRAGVADAGYVSAPVTQT